MDKLIKKLEAEINKTQTGELRNLLCDANITLQDLLQVGKSDIKNKSNLENYNFQIQDSFKGWEEIPSRTVAFGTRQEAVDFAYQLSHCVQLEIRLSQGNYKTANGTYIKM